jgi:hypothetical protein
MKDCTQFDEMLFNFKGDKSLDNESEAHLKHCAQCRALYLNTVALYDALNAEKNTPSPPFLSTRVMAALEKVDTEKGLQHFIRKELQVAFVVLALMMGAGSAMLFQPKQTYSDEPSLLAEYFDMESDGLEQQWLNFNNYEE